MPVPYQFTIFAFSLNVSFFILIILLERVTIMLTTAVKQLSEMGTSSSLNSFFPIVQTFISGSNGTNIQSKAPISCTRHIDN